MHTDNERDVMGEMKEKDGERERETITTPSSGDVLAFIIQAQQKGQR